MMATTPHSPHSERWMEFVSNSEDHHVLDPRKLYWAFRAFVRIVLDAYQLEVREQ